MPPQLNPQQQRAVVQVSGRVLIIAGAGSGKTRVLTHRMAHLIEDLGVTPKAILGLTFTNKAAAEMRHRLQGLIDPRASAQVTLSTFHSFCLGLLRDEIHRLGYTREFSLYNEYDVGRVINAITRDVLELEGELPSLAKSIELLNTASNRGLKSTEIIDTTSCWHQDFVQTLHQRLEAGMRAYNAVDFDRLLSLSVQLFEEFPAVLDAYQERYRYIMVDEYQDTNPIQYRLTSLLAQKYGNLCVVGDDDQSIYGWRGADLQNILNFDHAEVITLEQNYRSTNSILQAAHALVSRNAGRREKQLWSLCGEGEPIEIFVAPDESKEAEAVAARLVKLRREKNLKWNDMAILYRSNSLSRQFELALAKQHWLSGERWVQGIPYRLYGAQEFYDRREVKDLFAYLRVVCNPSDQEALLRIINLPRRGIGDAVLDKLTTYNRLHKQSLWHVILGVTYDAAEFTELKGQISTKALQGLQEFVEVIDETGQDFNTHPWVTCLNQLITRIDYKRAIREEVKSTQMRDFKWENVTEFITAATEFEAKQRANGKEPLLSEFIQEAPLDHAWDGEGKADAEDDKVHMLTFHSSKGLEFPACFLVGVEESIIPHAKSLAEGSVEEERRLMYVAITRAMRHLTISMAMFRMRMGEKMSCLPSSFLSEIPQNLLHKVDWRIY